MWIQRCEEKIAPSVGERKREGEEGFGSSFYMFFFFFFVSPGPVLCKLGLGRSVVCFT